MNTDHFSFAFLGGSFNDFVLGAYLVTLCVLFVVVYNSFARKNHYKYKAENKKVKMVY